MTHRVLAVAGRGVCRGPGGRARRTALASISALAFAWLCGVPPSHGAPCAQVPFGIVAWYPLDEPSGASTIVDVHTSVNSVGPPHHGTPQPGPVGLGPANGPARVVGLVGAGALYFYGGPSRFVAVPPHLQLDFGTGDFSIDAWIRPVDVGQTVGGFIQPLVDKLDPVPPAGFALYLEGDTVGPAPHPSRLKFTMNGTTIASNGTIPFADPLTNTGPWTHVAVTVKRSGPAQGVLYINGAPDTVFTPPPPSVDNGLFMWIGETRVPGPRGEIAIDELEIFNTALTATEVAALSGAGAAGKCRVTRVSASVGVNQAIFALGQTITTTLGLSNPGLAENADFYLGVLAPTGAIAFFTGAGGIAFGSVANLASFQPISVAVPLTTAFSAAVSPFFTYQWTGSEPYGDYVFFLLVTKTGALSDGVLTDEEILGLALEPFSFL